MIRRVMRSWPTKAVTRIAQAGDQQWSLSDVSPDGTTRNLFGHAQGTHMAYTAKTGRAAITPTDYLTGIVPPKFGTTMAARLQGQMDAGGIPSNRARQMGTVIGRFERLVERVGLDRAAQLCRQAAATELDSRSIAVPEVQNAPGDWKTQVAEPEAPAARRRPSYASMERSEAPAMRDRPLADSRSDTPTMRDAPIMRDGPRRSGP